MSMSAHKLLASVDLGRAIIILMESSMSAPAIMEQWPQDPILMALLLVLVGKVHLVLSDMCLLISSPLTRYQRVRTKS